MQRYFVKEKIDNQIILNEQDIHHIKKVMRCKINDTIEAVYKEKIYLCQISSLEPLSLEIVDTYNEDREMSIDLTIAISLVTEQKFDLILQKITELGVSKIIPVKTERSIVKLDKNKEEKKLQRWRTICKEASEQSHRTKIPEVSNIITLKELLKEEYDLKLVCSLNEKTQTIDKYLKDDIKKILFIVGPEGGFSQQEENLMLENGFEPVTLGKRVLRVETAAIYVASIMNYIYEG